MSHPFPFSLLIHFSNAPLCEIKRRNLLLPAKTYTLVRTPTSWHCCSLEKTREPWSYYCGCSLFQVQATIVTCKDTATRKAHRDTGDLRRYQGREESRGQRGGREGTTAIGRAGGVVECLGRGIDSQDREGEEREEVKAQTIWPVRSRHTHTRISLTATSQSFLLAKRIFSNTSL